MGIAILEKGNKDRIIYSECFETSSKDAFLERLEQIGRKTKDIIEKYSPDIMAIESLFITKNQKTAMRVSEARGVIMYEAICKNIIVHEYTPLQVKMAITSNGKRRSPYAGEGW